MSAVTLFQTMVVESIGNTSLVRNIKADQSVPASQNTHNKKNVLNQEDYRTVKSDPSTDSPGSKPCKQPKINGADWTEVFDGLKSAIKMRHYSPKTSKTYSGWTRRF
jgi:hypothetical protein